MPYSASHWREYFLYFLDEKGVLQARHDFIADNDAEAAECADFLISACCDVCASGELWGGARLLTRVFAKATPDRIQRLSPARQEQIIDLEEMLLSSRSHIAKSRQLVETIEAARRER